MTHGYPDYGVGAPKKTIFPVLDVGELSARLGSPVTFDRRGDVMWFDNFEDTLMRWNSNQAMNGTRLFQTAEAARSGSFSCKMITPNAADTDTYLYRNLPLPVQSKIGLEFSYAMYLQIDYLYAKLRFFERGTRYDYQLRYDRYNRTMAYLNKDGGYTNLDGLVSHSMLYHAWNTIKLVVDYENKKYVRALLNDWSWDLSGIPGEKDTNSYTPALFIEARITNRATGDHYIYLDDVILTQNEP